MKIYHPAWKIFLISRLNCTRRIITFIAENILLLNNVHELYNANTMDILQKLQNFLTSCGKFTTGAYIVSTYGSSELVQAFCRYSSIHNCIYILRCSIQFLTFLNKSFEIQSTPKQHISSSKILILSINYLPSEYFSLISYSTYICYTILSKKSILNHSKKISKSNSNQSFIASYHSLKILQMGHDLSVSCPNIYVTYIYKKKQNNNDTIQSIYNNLIKSLYEHHEIIYAGVTCIIYVLLIKIINYITI